jgi:ketosteroid isomerase-like protein
MQSVCGQLRFRFCMPGIRLVAMPVKQTAMNINHKLILQQANAAIAQGDHEGFLAFCTDDTEWIFVGERVLRGKEAVRQWMAEAYTEPPRFIVEALIAEGNYLTALGKITLKGDNYQYCDIWQFRDGKLAALKAFVIKA